MRRTVLTKLSAYAFAIASVAVCTDVRSLLNPLLVNQRLQLAFMIPVVFRHTLAELDREW